MFVGDDKRLLKHLTGALSGTNCGYRCIAKRAGTICCAPNITVWLWVRLIAATLIGADVNSDGNSVNHMDGPFSGAIGWGCSPVLREEMAFTS
jgi:hypothetical protein